MSLTVKAYLTRVGQQEPEIRRFGIDADVSSNFNYFISKINAIFPGLTGKAYTLGWKDAESDLILFSSDEELTEALGYVNDGVFKVYINEKPDSASTEPGPERKRGHRLHRNVVCDGCQGPVIGIRYKCEVCPDFDLCEGCKGKGLHPEHSLRAIERPFGCRWKEFAFGGEGAGPHGFAFHCMNPPFPGGPGASADAGPVPPPEEFGPGHMPPFWGGFDFSAMPPHLAFRMQRKMMRKWWRKYGKDCKKAHKRSKDEKKQEKKEKKEKKKKVEKSESEKGQNVENEEKERQRKDSTSSSSSSSSSSSDEGEGEQSPSESYLKTVGNSVAAMLDPLGIDVQVDVEHNGNRKRCHRGPWGPQWGCQGGFGGPWGGFGGMRGRGGFGARGRGGPAWCGFGRWGQQPASADEQKQQQGPAAEKEIPVNTETGEERKDSSAGSSSPREGEWTLLAKPNADVGMNDVEGAARGVENLHVSPEADVVRSTAATSLAASASTSGNNAVDKAVAQMQSMGYNDNGGWLTALLTTCNGDVNLALDAMQAKK